VSREGRGGWKACGGGGLLKVAEGEEAWGRPKKARVRSGFWALELMGKGSEG